MTDIVIEDEYIRSMKMFSYVQGIRFERVLSEYITIMNRLNEEGIVRGQTADTLRAFIETAGNLRGKVQELSELFQKLLEQYLSDIDDADRELY